MKMPERRKRYNNLHCLGLTFPISLLESALLGMTGAKSMTQSLDTTNELLLDKVPSTLGELTRLTHLWLDWNGLQGEISSSLSDFTHLLYIPLPLSMEQGMCLGAQIMATDKVIARSLLPNWFQSRLQLLLIPSKLAGSLCKSTTPSSIGIPRSCIASTTSDRSTPMAVKLRMQNCTLDNRYAYFRTLTRYICPGLCSSRNSPKPTTTTSITSCVLHSFHYPIFLSSLLV